MALIKHEKTVTWRATTLLHILALGTQEGVQQPVVDLKTVTALLVNSLKERRMFNMKLTCQIAGAFQQCMSERA